MNTLAEQPVRTTPHLVSTSGGRIAELDGIRAIAVALVIGCHYPAFASLLWGLPQFGWVGVEIFFVLSGYLITTNLFALKGKPRAYQVFYSRRARRILPPYVLTVAGCLLLARLVTGHFDIKALVIEATFLKSLLGAPMIFHSVLGRVPDLLAQPVAGPLQTLAHTHIVSAALNPTWSLSIEEWFYLLWAPVILRFSKSGVVATIAFSLALGCLLRGMAHATGIEWYENFFCRLDTLALGAALALWMRQRKIATEIKLRIGDRLISQTGVASAVLLAALLFWIRPVLGHEIRISAAFAAFGMPLLGVATASAVAWIVLHASGRSLVCRALRLPPMVWIGRRSYTTYLVHFPWYCLTYAFFRVHSPAHFQWPAAICALTLSILTAAISWEFIEAPLLKR